MKRIHIFKAGKHTDSAGAEITFSREDVADLAASYDPKLHEAPIVIGHPQDNAPAFGWIDRVEVQGDDVFAIPKADVNGDFADMVAKGLFKKVSASIYLKDSPTNPTPGKLHLRHVGFLGAQPPAIKGLSAIQFSADDKFSTFEESYEHEHSMIARLMRGLRDWLISDKGMEAADKVLPAYAIEELERSNTARQMKAAPATPAYSEGTEDMDAKELKAAQDKLAADIAAHNAAVASFTERDNALKARESAADAKDCRDFCEDLVKQGKMLPANVNATVAALLALSTTGEVSFAEGDKTVKVTPRDALKNTLKNGPKLVDFKEHDDGAGSVKTKSTPAEFGEKVRAHQAASAAKGKVISFTQAAHEIQATDKAAA